MSHRVRLARSMCPALTAFALMALAGCAAESKTETQEPAAAAAPPPATTAPAETTIAADQSTLDKPGSYAVIAGKKEPVPVVPMGDPATIARILAEGKRNNRVMEHLTHLTTGIGPRLTGSSRLEQANRWAAEQFRSWGLSESRSAAAPTEGYLWKWGEIPVRFDRGPSTAKVVVARNPSSESPEYRTLREMEFTALAWSAGTDGPVRGPVLKMPENEEQFEAMKDQIKGAWLLIRAHQQGARRGVMAGGGIGARQRLFADIRRKWEGMPPEGDDRTPPPAPFPKDGVSGLYEGTVTGGRAGGDGLPAVLEVRLGENNTVTGSLAFGRFRTSPMRDGKYNPETGELTCVIEGRGGTTPYTFTIKNGTATGESKPEEGEPMKFTAKLSDPETEKAQEPDTPSLEERVLALGPAGFISASGDERVRTTSAPGWRNLNFDRLPKDVEIQVRQSDYDYMNSRLADGMKIEVEVDLQHTFTNGPIPVYNTIAEIPGTVWPDEVVIVSAHLDSWDGPGSQGTTDNGTGSAVTLEAARLLMSAKARPKRTIRFILWTGEEQGLLGSRAYVNALRETGELDKVSAVFVDDGGTNYEGGLQCIESQVPYLAAATAPINGHFYSEVDKKFLDVNVQASRRMGGGMTGGSSDHASFLQAGVPGFFWDEVGRADYYYGWHTQNDKIDLAIPEYLIQSSTCAAITAYNLACAPDLLPRPVREEAPERGRGRPRGGQQGDGNRGGPDTE